MATCSFLVLLFDFQSFTADLIASSASTTQKVNKKRFLKLLEQCSFTGGRDNSFAMSTLVIFTASHTFNPLIFSVTREEEAIADPHPNVLNLQSLISPVSSSTIICNFMTSPHAGAPTRPVPTLMLFLSRLPTFRGEL